MTCHPPNYLQLDEGTRNKEITFTVAELYSMIVAEVKGLKPRPLGRGIQTDKKKGEIL